MMLKQKMIEYFNKFGDSFPMIPLAWGRTNKQIIDIIDECLGKSKNVYELGYIKDDPHIRY